jgi:translation initiation factor IF-2
MGVRLNKVLSELNIGLQTAVDFLKNKKELGEVKDEMTPNTKISDEQYQALVGEFKGDKAVKTQADMIFTKKIKEKKPEKVEKVVEKKITATEEQLEHRPQFKPVGKIDLDAVGKKPAEKKMEEEAPVTAAESPVEEP